MNILHDLLIDPPISKWLLDFLLFLTFSLHFIFVLLLIGTAILSVYYFVATWYRGEPIELPWFKEILKTFLAHKSIAVVLGVAALLLIQVGYTVPFFMGVTIYADYWMLIIIFLIIAFLSFDALGHKRNALNKINLPGGIISLFFLLIVPGIFVAVLSTAERSEEWTDIIKNGNQLFGSLTIHWLFRYLHVIGAAIVFSAAFHFFFSTKREKDKKDGLVKWTIFGLLIQIIIGILLFATVQQKFDLTAYITMFIGIAAALIFLWYVIDEYGKRENLNSKAVVIILLMVLLPMLLTRQLLQYKGFNSIQAELRDSEDKYKSMTNEYREPALAAYQEKLATVYNNPETIYQNSCAFCHSLDGSGNGEEARFLTIPPEKINAVRTTKTYLYETLKNGVNGTGMPYFTYYVDTELEDLMDYLNLKFNILAKPGAAREVSQSALTEAVKYYAEMCSSCHGADGKGETKLGKGLEPPTPDLTQYTLTAERTFEVITDGYDGTMMRSFKTLPKEVRWGLVKVVLEKRVD